jgi:hypothetical protein
MGVVLGVDPMEPTEKPFAAAPLRRVLLLRLRRLPFLYPLLCLPPFRFWFWSGGADKLLI